MADITIDEAIGVNGGLARELDIPERAKERAAVRLGIEALKRLKEQRSLKYVAMNLLLPGETE